MAKGSDFKLITAQTVIWTPNDLAFFNSSKILATLLPKFKDKFNGEMNVLPPFQIPQNVPVNVPQIMLKSGDGHWQLSMSPVRADSIWTSGPSLDEGRIEYMGECAEALKEYIASFNAHVVRMALVTSRICFVDDPAAELIGRFCNQASLDGPFVRSQAFEVHNFKTYKPAITQIDYSLNSWVRCKALEIPSKGKAIVIENDLNTPENQTTAFSSEQVEGFFSAAPLETNDILRRYFG